MYLVKQLQEFQKYQTGMIMYYVEMIPYLKLILKHFVKIIKSTMRHQKIYSIWKYNNSTKIQLKVHYLISIP